MTVPRPTAAPRHAVVLADHGQFYIQDVEGQAAAEADEDYDWPEAWSEEAVAVHRIGLDGPCSIAIGTARSDHVETTLRVHPGEAPRVPGAVHVVEADLAVPSGAVHVFGGAELPGPRHRVEVPPGRYRLRVSHVPAAPPPVPVDPCDPGPHLLYHLDLWPRAEGRVSCLRVVLTVRVGGLGDVAGIARLWVGAARARQAELGLPLGPVAGVGPVEAERQVRRRLAGMVGTTGAAGFVVLAEELGEQQGEDRAEGQGEVVAMALVVPALAQDGAGAPVAGLAHVSMVAVDPRRWGQGHGARVMEEARRIARERGYVRAQLWTHESNRRAQRLYEKLGWVATGRTLVDHYGEAIRHYTRDL